MNTTNLLLLFLLILSITYSILLKIKLHNLKKKTISIIEDVNKPLRLGYYKLHLEASNSIVGSRLVDVIVYVNEINRYKNGESKIKIKSFDVETKTNTIDHNKIENFVTSNFISIVKTSSIEWLDEIEDIKQNRKLKIKNLEKLLKK